jgi:hypothetical protein
LLQSGLGVKGKNTSATMLAFLLAVSAETSLVHVARAFDAFETWAVAAEPWESQAKFALEHGFLGFDWYC